MPGISAAFSENDSTTKTFYGLFQVHHRGQGSSGMSVAGDKSIRTYSDNGLMQTVFPEKIMNMLVHNDDYASIGHVGRGNENQKRIPPIEVDAKDFKLSVAMDGMILNHSEVDKKFGLNTKTDEELFGKIFYKNLKSDEIEKAASHTMNDLDKAYYSLVMLVLDKNRNESKLIGLRDKRGVRPMYMGRNGKDFVIASESGAIDVLERMEDKMKERRDVNPGELLVASKDRFYTKQIVPSEPANCGFEWVYTARPDAKMNGINAHEVRKRLGRSLVELHNIKDDGNSIVGGVPDSGRSVAIGISEASGIPFDELMIKNQYVMRTYIIKDPEKRRISAFLKHNTIEEVVKGKRVIIGDDSIVRGTISEEISRIIKDAGAKEVTFAVSYAPIFEPCFEDEPNKILAAAEFKGMNVYEIGKKVAKKLPSIDKVLYNDVDSVVKAIGLPRNHLCTKCISCEDPFEK
jgi:amidophosphoribosyltransferase